MSNTPTPEELGKLAEECGIGWAAGLGGMDDFLSAFARAVLAKWGTPQQVVQEPFCYVSVNKQGDITRTMKRKDKWTNIPLYTTPQPAQVQPVVREPLTNEQRMEVFNEARKRYDENPNLAWRVAILEQVEIAHGITQKGGSNAE